MPARRAAVRAGHDEITTAPGMTSPLTANRCSSGEFSRRVSGDGDSDWQCHSISLGLGLTSYRDSWHWQWNRDCSTELRRNRRQCSSIDWSCIIKQHRRRCWSCSRSTWARSTAVRCYICRLQRNMQSSETIEWKLHPSSSPCSVCLFSTDLSPFSDSISPSLCPKGLVPPLLHPPTPT